MEEIKTREQLTETLAQWVKEGFHGATSDGSAFCFYYGWPIEKFGTVARNGGLVRPSSAGGPPFVYRVEAEKYERRYEGKLGRILDDGTGKWQYRAARISEELALELRDGSVSDGQG